MITRSRVVAAIGIAMSIALCTYGVVANAPTAGNSTSGETGLPAIISTGDKGEILYDVHATLNSEFENVKLTSKSEDTSQDSEKNKTEVIDLAGRFTYRETENTHVLITKQAEQLHIPKTWNVTARNNTFWEIFAPKDAVVESIEFGDRPIESFGVYGDQTKALVMLFQIQNNLRATGEVDASTLHLLEPLRPASRPALNVLTSATKWLILPTDVENTTDGKETTVRQDYAGWIKPVTTAIAVVLILLVSAIAFRIARRGSGLIAAYFERRSRSHGDNSDTSRWFEELRRQRVFSTMAHLAPAFVIFLAQFAFPNYWIHEYEPGPIWEYPGKFFFWSSFFAHFGLAYINFSVLLVALGFVNAWEGMWSLNSEGGGTFHPTEDTPVDSEPVATNTRGKESVAETELSGVVRFIRSSVIVVGVILICAALVGQSPWTIIGGLGAFMAIIVLVFKDSILGLVASVNIMAHKTVQVGDWIELPKHGVDGDVISISLTTIKVRNFDKTIVSIPTYLVMTDSFKNWRGMQESGARRIKRAIYIDMNSIRPVNLELCERFEAMTLLTGYISDKRDELREQLVQSDVVMSRVNSRWLTNVGTYRVYLENYLKQHASIHPDLTCLVRQLKPTSEGLPIEIYAFANETDWKEYERIQSDVFDHAISVLREFDLRAYQSPSGYSHREFEIPQIDHTAWHVGLGRLQHAIEEENQRLAAEPQASVAAAIARIEKMADELAAESDGSVTFEISRNGRSIVVIDCDGG